MNATPLGPSIYAFLGLSLIIAALVSLIVFALWRFSAAARRARGEKESGGEIALLTAALHEAVSKLKAQERETAARAEASERLNDEIVSSLTAGLLVVDLQGRVKILNRAGRRVLGLPDEDSVTQEPAELLQRSARDAPLFAVIDECLATHRPVVRRTVTLPTIGRGVHLGVTVSPLFDGSGSPHGAICLFTDLTSVRALEEQLRLKESLATVGELTAGIAHEFRNGLATIHGYSKLIDIEALPKGYRPYVEGIRAETASLSEVVTNFLNFARPAELTLSHVDLGAICSRAADDFRSDVINLGGELHISGEFGTVYGDEVLLRQAFSNLLRNAVEACQGSATAPVIAIESQIDEAQSFSTVTVHDNGPGVLPALGDRIFQPFVTGKRSGTGLGLALVQKIVVYHNGRITVGEGPRRGASFQVMLPSSGGLGRNV
jgi:PAS domain S-box-containing protein